ncbi:MAG: hypothetical protein ACKN9K_19995, partial [Dolichospermum sp.]
VNPPENITQITQETELLEEKVESVKELELINSDQVDDLYASFSDSQISPINLSFYDDPLVQEDRDLSPASTEVVSELISNDLLTPQPTETQDDQNYNEISTISDTPQEGKSTIDELQANNTDTITVLTD